MKKLSIRTLVVATVVGVAGMTMVGCTTTKESAQGSQRSDRVSLDAQVDATLSRLYQAAPGSRELIARAKGVLVFPAVIGGSFVIGVEHGEGQLRVGNKAHSRYTTSGASIGWQAGGQSKAVIYVFSTQDSLDKFVNGNGWSGGVDATVAAGHVGANGSIDTQTIQAPVSSYVLTNTGLEAGVSLQGSKITRVTR
ncbi:BPSL1445 family SYLF domain-containing lipoprotein [Simplicispira psychrophila]|uniref:BPSL1445 family SYLF domain-containing lipoprotein n=1 Tax=Simplicispira psychrophila TaxID=80882 RepID=UPI0004878A9D|nr:YSC84-related protein [Simplicispira psychrophila]